jgi:PKD repeat protein
MKDLLRGFFLSLWLLSLPVAALDLYDGANFVYDVQTGGALAQGAHGVYRNLYRLRVNGREYNAQVQSVGAGGEQVVFNTFTEAGSGLRITRSFFVPRRENFARYVDAMHNPGNTTATARVEVFGALGGAPVAVVDRGNYLITRDTATDLPVSRPLLLHYHSQIGNPYAASHTFDGNNLSWQYANVSIPPQATVYFVYFIAQTESIAQAQALAARIGNSEAPFFDALDPAMRQRLINIVPVTPVPRQDYSLAPRIHVGEQRHGVLQSNAPFSRIRALVPADAYALDLNVGQQVTLRLSAAFDSVLYVFGDVSGSTLLSANRDAHHHTTNAEIVFTAPRSGRFYLEATSHDHNQLGAYTLEVINGATNRLPQIAPIQVSSGDLIAPVDVSFTDFSTDAEGPIAEYCWDFGDNSPLRCGSAASVTHRYTRADIHTVNVQLKDSHGAIAAHSVQVPVQTSSGAVILPVNSNYEGALQVGDSYSETRSDALADRYVISAAAPGKVVVVEMHSSAFDSYLYLYDAYGRYLREDDNSAGGHNARLIYTPQNEGRLILEATSAGRNMVGNYTLSVRLMDAAEIPLNPVLERFPRAADALANTFRVRLPEGVRVNSLQWNFGAGGAQSFTDGALAAYRYPRSGVYTVQVSGTLSDGRHLNLSRSFNISAQTNPVQANFRVTPVFGDKQLQSYFFNTSSSSLSTDPLSYLWDFGDGRVSTEISPVHFYTAPGTYNVALTATSGLTGLSASIGAEVVVLDRTRPNQAVSGAVPAQPQVLLAGFDPILIDMADTHFTVFALVRPGHKPVRAVLLQSNPGLVAVLHHAATYADGTLRYEAVYPFRSGDFPATVLSDVFGANEGEWSLRAIDEDGQFHDFPRLEVGHYPTAPTANSSYYLAPARQPGVRREAPQVLGAGFDTPFVHLSQTGVEILALVREGVYPLHSVIFQDTAANLRLPMRLKYILPNGDKLFSATYTYPVGTFPNGSSFDLFGSGPWDFHVEASDQSGLNHRYPELRFGNYPRR